MRAETERLFDGTFGKIVRGVVAGNCCTVVRKLHVAQLIDLADGGASANSGSSAAQRDDRGSVGALDERAGVCGDGPWRPLARFVRGGFAAGIRDIDRWT